MGIMVVEKVMITALVQLEFWDKVCSQFEVIYSNSILQYIIL